MVRAAFVSENEPIRRKQLFGAFSNCMLETSQVDVDNTKLTLYYQDPATKELWQTTDSFKIFGQMVNDIEQFQEIQFIQLAEDDRKILPRVVRDDETLKIEMFNYKTD